MSEGPAELRLWFPLHHKCHADYDHRRQPLGSLALNRTGGGRRDAPAGERHPAHSEQ
ncbi:hypothetical protein OG863_36815 [Streptomyces decoyicus]|uniref:Uncharacterized protein n=1 Tax=Streptomyces decoyicus TaxID=249567 RepID=A0ABZ1FSF8_9ACTN|nr:hypothetical protein [Streptomyces decoyicus]WSB73076.1 hypothetical protein OG863_36815 [Streptomyces decoyicus]